MDEKPERIHSMKKMITMLLALMLMLTACAQDATPEDTTASTAVSTTTAPETTEPEVPEEPELKKSAQVEVLACSFKDQVLPTDHEAYVGWFPEEEGKVYVDLTMRVQNTGEAPIGEEDITGWFEYEGQRIDMQLEVEANAGDFENVDKTVPVGETKIAHLFYTVDAAAEGASISAHYSVLGEEDQIQVDDYVPPVLEDKIQMKIGDVFGREGEYTVEVLDCLISDTLRATGDGAVKYYVEGHEAFDLILRIRNEGDSELDLLEGYLMVGQETEYATEELEINDNKELEALSDEDPIGPGEEVIVHLWVAVPLDTPAEGMVLRFNIQGDSFYCHAVG